MKTKSKFVLLAALLAILILGGWAPSARSALFSVGPTDLPVPPGNGFPRWYTDTSDLTMELCLPKNQVQVNAGICGPFDLPNPLQPIVFPTNFSGESFYFLADSVLNLAASDEAVLVLGLEATFGAGVPEPDAQIVFGRLRIVVDAPVNGDYEVTTPYGVFNFPNVVAGPRAIVFPSDIGGGLGDFTGALQSQIGPFLRATATLGGTTPLPPVTLAGDTSGDLFLSNGAAPVFVTGSPVNTNYFEICLASGVFPFTGTRCVRQNQFNLTGRVFQGTPFVVDEAYYGRNASGAGTVNVFGTTSSISATASYAASGTGLTTEVMTKQGTTRNLFASIPFAADTVLPATVTVTATDPGKNPTAVLTNLVDLVTITQAVYNEGAQSLTINAASSDLFAPPTLTATGLGALVNGVLVVTNLLAPPTSVTVTSSRGGTDTAVVITVGVFPTPPEITSIGPGGATAGILYTNQAAATGTAPLTWSLVTFPTGMTIGATTGLIQWTPTAGQAGSNPVTVRVSNAGGADTLTFNVLVVIPPPVITSIGPTGATVGVLYTNQAAATGTAPLTWSLVTFPAGMTIGATTGLIQWTPTVGQAGSNPVTVRVTNGGGFDTLTFNVVVVIPPPVITSIGPTGATVGVLYTNQAAATGTAPLTWSLDPGFPTGMTISATGLIQWTPTVGQVGSNPVTVRVTNGGGADTLTFNVVVVVVAIPPPVITSIGPTGATVGVLYTNQAAATGTAPLVWSLDPGFPTGMTIGATTGLIQWTPAAGQAGSNLVTVRVTNGGGADALTFNVVVVIPPPVITSIGPTGAAVGVLYTNQVVATGSAPLVWSLDPGFPTGMTIGATTGLIQWTPAAGQVGSHPVTARVTNAGGADVLTFSVVVGDQAPVGPQFVVNDFDGDGKTDFAYWRGADSFWYILDSLGFQKTVHWGTTGDKIVSGDYDGDRRADIAVWRPADGTWYVIRSSDGVVTTTEWGTGTLFPDSDIPVPGDYDGDGKTDVAVWRPGDGVWYVKRSLDGVVTTTPWGLGIAPVNDIPVPGDYDGDGKTDLAVWRPGDGTWYVKRSLDGVVTTTPWGSGTVNDVPVAGDYDGDGKTDLAVWRPGEGNWYINRSSDSGVTVTNWGLQTAPYNDIPVPGDYDGDGKTDIAVYRPGTVVGTGIWYIIPSGTGIPYATVWGGDPTDVPIGEK